MAARCYDAHEAGQIERKRGALRRARASFATCGAPDCPAIVQRDCSAWAAELTTQQPSVVFAVVRGNGADVVGARVLVDGAPIALDGRALELDPGEHLVRAEAPSQPAVERRITVREGERTRRVAIVLGESKPPVRASPPAGVWVLGGVSALSLATFGTFAVLGKSRENELTRTCVDRCTDDDVAGVRRAYIVADASLALAVATAGAAVVAWVLLPKVRGPARAPSAAAPSSAVFTF